MGTFFSVIIGILIIAIAVRIFYTNIKNSSKGKCAGCSYSKTSSNGCNCCSSKVHE